MIYPYSASIYLGYILRGILKYKDVLPLFILTGWEFIISVFVIPFPFGQDSARQSIFILLGSVRLLIWHFEIIFSSLIDHSNSTGFSILFGKALSIELIKVELYFSLMESPCIIFPKVKDERLKL